MSKLCHPRDEFDGAPKKIITLAALALTATLIPSCADIQAGMKGLTDEMFEPSIQVDAVVYRVGDVTYQESLGSTIANSGIGNTKRASKAGSNVDKYTGSQGSYVQKIWVKGGGYNVSGTRTCSGYSDYLSSGQRGILYIGQKTHKFKKFEPTY